MVYSVNSPGGDNNAGVVMSTYDPKGIRCRGSFPDPVPCKDVLADMPASTDVEVFGPRDARLVKEILPQTIASRKCDTRPVPGLSDLLWLTNLVTKEDNECIVKLFSSTGRSDITSWYRIWEAVEATFAVCARFRMSGSHRGLGGFPMRSPLRRVCRLIVQSRFAGECFPNPSSRIRGQFFSGVYGLDRSQDGAVIALLLDLYMRCNERCDLDIQVLMGCDQCPCGV